MVAGALPADPASSGATDTSAATIAKIAQARLVAHRQLESNGMDSPSAVSTTPASNATVARAAAPEGGGAGAGEPGAVVPAG